MPSDPRSPISALETLIAEWRNEAARYDSFHATMGSGWHVCANELESALRALGSQPPTTEHHESRSPDGDGHLKRPGPDAEAANKMDAGSGSEPDDSHPLPLGTREPPPEPETTNDERCAVCGWPLVNDVNLGCVRGNCSLRPFPHNFYAPKRAAREYGQDLTQFDPRAVLPPPPAPDGPAQETT